MVEGLALRSGALPLWSVWIWGASWSEWKGEDGIGRPVGDPVVDLWETLWETLWEIAEGYLEID